MVGFLMVLLILIKKYLYDYNNCHNITYSMASRFYRFSCSWWIYPHSSRRGDYSYLSSSYQRGETFGLI